jgi:hypothetical protein
MCIHILSAFFDLPREHFSLDSSLIVAAGPRTISPIIATVHGHTTTPQVGSLLLDAVNSLNHDSA